LNNHKHVVFYSDEASTINHQIGEYIDPNFWHPPHMAAGDSESNSYYSGAHPHSIHDLSRRTSVSFLIINFQLLIFNQLTILSLTIFRQGKMSNLIQFLKA
jgi:hypothetical protein